MTLVSNITSLGMSRLKAAFGFVFLGVVAALAGSVAAWSFAAAIVGWVYWGIVIAEFAVLFWFMFTKNPLSYYLFTFLTGVTLVPVLSALVSAGAGGAIVSAFLGTAMITAGLTLHASTTKKDYISMGQMLFWILIGVLVMSIANIFIGSPILALGISIVAVVLFSFFILHDVQVAMSGEIEPIDAAMNIYLDILNLFVNLLQIFASFTGSDD